jgi:hypothetical protein
MPLELFDRMPPSGAADDARLHANLASAVEQLDVAPVAGDDGQDAVRHRLAGEAGARGPEGERDPQAAAEPEELPHLRRRGRVDDRPRDEAVDAGVVGVGDPVDRARQHPFYGQDARQLACKLHRRHGNAATGLREPRPSR